MKVRVHPGDQRGVGYCRMIWPAEAVRDHQGVDVEIADGFPRVTHRLTAAGLNPDRAHLVDSPGQVDADVLVFQRPSHPDLVDWIPILQKRGHAIVIDVDDDLHSVSTQNVAYGWENPQRVLRACARADLVTVTSPALARRYAPHGRVAVVPNCVPQAVVDLPPATGEEHTIGWGGWAGSHPGDLEATHGGVAQAIDRTGARFLVVGPGEEVQQRLGLTRQPSATGPLTDVADYSFERALSQLDIGIVPLADTQFNAAKSWLKGLQYAARGVPFVASDVAEYRRLADLGAGVLAPPRGRNWRARILDLFTDDTFRAELAESGRQVAADWTYEHQAGRWADAWGAALEHRRTAGRAA